MIESQSEAPSKRKSASHLDIGIVTARAISYNQNGVIVITALAGSPSSAR
jgi:acyl dehydratase